MRPQYLCLHFAEIWVQWLWLHLRIQWPHLWAPLLHKTTYCFHVLESANKSPLHTWVEMPYFQYWNAIQHRDFTEFKPRSIVLNNTGSWIGRHLVSHLGGSSESQNRKTLSFCFVFHLLFIFLGKRNYITPIPKTWRTREEHLVSIWAYKFNTEISSLNILTMHLCPTATFHTCSSKLLSLLAKKTQTPIDTFCTSRTAVALLVHHFM